MWRDVTWTFVSHSLFIDPMLGTGVKTWRIMGSSLRQVCIRRYRHAGSGARRTVLEQLVDLTLLFRFPSWSRNVAGGLMAHFLLPYTVRSSSITYIALRIALRANYGSTSNSSTRRLISSSLGLPSCVSRVVDTISLRILTWLVCPYSRATSLSRPLSWPMPSRTRPSSVARQSKWSILFWGIPTSASYSRASCSPLVIGPKVPREATC